MPNVPAKPLQPTLSLVERMKKAIQQSGQSKRQIVSLKSGEQVRMRFLKELNEGLEVLWHENFDDKTNVVNAPCAFHYGRSSCKHCDDVNQVTARQTPKFFWPVFVYYPNPKPGEPKGELKLIPLKATKRSALNPLINHDNEHKSITGCDFVMERQGDGFETTYVLTAGVAEAFRIKGVKVPTAAQINEMLAKAFDLELLEPEEEDEDEEVEEAEEDEEEDEEDEEVELVDETVAVKETDEDYSKLFGDSDGEEEEVKPAVKKAVLNGKKAVAKVPVAVGKPQKRSA